MEILLKNPLTLWLRWLLQWSIYKVRFAGKHLRMEYLTEISSCTFSEYNTLYKYSRLRDVQMGRFSYVGRESQVYHARIGSFTSIGPQVLIGLGEHPSEGFVSTHPMFYSDRGQSNPVIVDKPLFDEMPTTTIGNDVWIGARAILRTGVTIGDGAIIAAGAVVVKDVEPYSIVGGIPAKHIRYRFTPEEIQRIQESNWWQQDLTWLKEHREAMTHISRFGLK
jgi:acetyltransferase-like isoleucine patch superfamily enzyme